MQKIIPYLKTFASLTLLSSIIQACNQEETLTTGSQPMETAPLDSLESIEPDYAQVRASIALKDIAGGVFNFGSDLDTTICETYGECDCCMDDFLFIDEQRFVRISYCVADYSLLRGTYEVLNSEIRLRYDSSVINCIYDWDKDAAGEAGQGNFYTTEISSMDEPFSEKFTGWKCKDGFFLKEDGETEYYGTRDFQTTVKSEIDLLRKDGTWDLLEW